MTLTPGTRLGPYEILLALGAGGMGEVYRARDTKLGRDVALKILPVSVADDPDRIARFKREAQVLAALNHPHIAAIYGFDADGATQFLVMELVDGETLADRLKRGPIPLDEAIAIARQIVEALAEAHDKGIIHRDLKPANVALSGTDQVKVLDFGLAKLAASPAVAGASSLSMSPTLTSPALMTGVGMILGTAAYMAPEQAKGREADKRSDVWAFGCVLYEMLTAKRAFEGEDVAETLATILKGDPEWSRLPSELPPELLRVLRRCLQKDPAKRRRDLGDMSVDLDDALAAQPRNAKVSRPRSFWLPWIVAGAASVGAVALALTRPSTLLPVTAPVVTFDVAIPNDFQAGAFLALAPDGTKLAFASVRPDGTSTLWIRDMASRESREVSGTDGAAFPFWSPDARSIAYFAHNELKKAAIAGGRPQTICVAGAGRGTWSGRGDILFSVGSEVGSVIYRVRDSGGTPEVLAKPDSAHGEAVAWPQFLPDDDHFLFLSIAGGTFTANVGSLTAPAATKTLGVVESAMFYSPPGYVVFGRGGNLLAQQFDTRALQLIGDSSPIGPLPAPSPIGSISASISRTGVLANRVHGDEVNRLSWYDRSGRKLSEVGEPSLYRAPALTDDDTRIAVERYAGSANAVWVIDNRGAMSRATFTQTADVQGSRLMTRISAGPHWSHDGRWLYYADPSRRTIQRQRPGGGAESEVVFEDSRLASMSISSLRADDSAALLSVADPRRAGTGDTDVWMLDLQSREATPLIATPFRERDAQFSPDGNWIAFTSNSSGRDEVYVRPYPLSGDQWQVSTAGGRDPKWRHDGQELFYASRDDTVMSVAVRTAPFVAAVPVALFQAPPFREYDVTANGQRFLLDTIVDRGATPITIIVNWPSLLTR